MNNAASTNNGSPYIEPKEILRALELSGDPFILTDVTGTIKYVSPGMEVMTGYTKEELIRRNTRIFRSGQTPSAIYRQMWTTILAGKPWSGTLVNKKKNGQPYLERLSISPIFDVKNRLALFCAKKEEVQQEHPINPRSGESAGKQTVTPRSMLQFINRATEELRSSLNTTKGFTDLLMENIEDDLELAKKDYLSIIRQTHRRMLNTIEDVMTIARLDVGDVKLHLEPVEIAKEMKRIITGLSVITVRHSMRVIKVIEDKGALVSIDRLGLEQIIMNLVSNALKFTGDGGYLTFGVNIQDNQALITVIDTGIGISDNFKPFIFQPFSQEEIGNRMEYEGAGLGLAITKRLTELMGGSIAFESRKNAGTTFMLLFPVVGWARTPLASNDGE
jgi:PAS domain S-box-containing protein